MAGDGVPPSLTAGEPAGPSRLRRLLGTVALLIVAWLLLTQVIFNRDSGGADRSDQVAAAAGASWCQREDYELRNRLDGSTDTIYDCFFRNGRERCVTLSGGISRDTTAEVRLLFAGTLGVGKPGCIA